MRRTILILFAFCFFLLSSCSPASSTHLAPAAPQLVFLQADASGSSHLVARAALHFPSSVPPFSLLPDCSVYNLYPNPVVPLLAVEFECGGGPALLFYDLQSGKTLDLANVLQMEARFLAWSTDGRFLYLKKNPLDDPQVIRVDRLSNETEALSLPATIYDLTTLPDGHIVYSTTQGIGFGSQTWQADADGRHGRQILAEPLDIVAYLRLSPDGTEIAFILLPDSQTPFPVGELWIMDISGKNARSLADADAGHGYAPAWSPDGTQIAFVARENPDNPQADLSAGALLSNVYRIEVQSGVLTPVTTFTDAIVETPVWSPDGAALFFNVVRDDTIRVWFEDAGILQPLSEEVTCCAVWVPGR